MKKEFRERECIHQDDGAEGAFYNGVFYLQALQRLPVDAAVADVQQSEFVFLGRRSPYSRVALSGLRIRAQAHGHSARDDSECQEASLRSSSRTRQGKGAGSLTCEHLL